MDENIISETETDVEEEALPITFDELLKDPEYQREFDKKVQKALEKSKAKWQKEAEEKRNEAEALARMSEEERHQVALKKEADRANKAEAELNAYRLKDEAMKIAKEKELDVNLLDIFDYSKETADSIKSKIDNLDSLFKKAVEKRTNDSFRQPSPKQVASHDTSAEKAYLDQKYKGNPYYKG